MIARTTVPRLAGLDPKRYLHRRISRSVLPVVCVTVTVLAAATAASAAAPCSGGRGNPRAIEHSRQHRAGQIPIYEFRLGTAGRPFVWSTVVDDFNADGIPDVAIADAGIGSGRSGGCIELIVSGQRRLRLPFRASVEPVRIDAVDVDRDCDLDIVATTAVGGKPVAVWLNDGSGRFTHGTAPDTGLPNSLRAPPTMRLFDPAVVATDARSQEPATITDVGRDPPMRSDRARLISPPAPARFRELAFGTCPRPPPTLPVS